MTLKNNKCTARPHLAHSGQSHGELHSCPAGLSGLWTSEKSRQRKRLHCSSTAPPLSLRCSSTAPPLPLHGSSTAPLLPLHGTCVVSTSSPAPLKSVLNSTDYTKTQTTTDFKNNNNANNLHLLVRNLDSLLMPLLKSATRKTHEAAQQFYR